MLTDYMAEEKKEDKDTPALRIELMQQKHNSKIT